MPGVSLPPKPLNGFFHFLKSRKMFFAKRKAQPEATGKINRHETKCKIQQTALT